MLSFDAGDRLDALRCCSRRWRECYGDFGEIIETGPDEAIELQKIYDDEVSLLKGTWILYS